MRKLLGLKYSNIIWLCYRKGIILGSLKVIESPINKAIVVNLKTMREHVHLFDSSREMNPAEEGKTADFFDVELEDNYTFDTTQLRYRLLTPNTPPRVLNFNLGTKQTDLIFME